MSKDEHGSMMYMDPMHVEIIYEHIMANRPAELLEIGAWDGFSTSAAVQAQRDGWEGFLVVCDVQIRPLVREMCDKDRTLFYEAKSLDLLNLIQPPETVIVDGDHSLEVCQAELLTFRDRGVRTIISHDCGRSGCDGPQAVLGLLLLDPQWRVWWDDKPREGMRTDRGLMIATRDPKVRLPG